MNDGSGGTNLAYSSTLSIVFFCVSCFFVVVPCNIPIPCILTTKNSSIVLKVDYRTSGLISICLLLLFDCMSLEQIYNGIFGNSMLEPYSILLLFLSLAYMSISLDQSGLFSFVAYFFAKRIGNSGKKFYLFIFLLSSILTIFTSNDIVIMTLTPVICYIAEQSSVNVTAFLIIQFFSANIWSAALYIGNPTNVIVAESVGMNFLEYSAWNVLPTCVAGISMLFLATIFMIWSIPDNVVFDCTNNMDSQALQVFHAIFGVLAMSLSLVLIITATFFSSIPVFIGALPVALIVFAKDLVWDLKENYFHSKSNAVVMDIEMEEVTSDSNSTIDIDKKIESFWITSKVLRRMPWNIVPFILGMFILVEVLDYNGWISKFANYFSLVIGESMLAAIVVIGFAAALACNVMNNQPMTILFVRIILHQNFLPNQPALISASLFAVALGSNFGANLTLIGALAGILWSQILNQHNQSISYFSFASYGFRVMIMVISLALLTLWAEFRLFAE